jgi:glycosyltransferase involved in cell wall biosynthesis
MNTNYKILIIGGPDVHARIEYIQHFNRKYNFTALGSSTNIKLYFTEKKIKYYDYYLPNNYNPIKIYLSLRNIHSLIKKIKPDIVHTFDTAPGILGRLASIVAGVPIVIGTQTGLGRLYSEDKSKNNNIILRLLKNINKFICSKSQMTIYQNYSDRIKMVNCKIVHTNNSELIISSGINTKKYSKDKIEKKSIYNNISIPEDAIVVTLISRLLKSKGIMEFCKAASDQCFNNLNIQFLLVGDIEKNNDEYIEITDLEPFQKKVHWLGHRKDIINILSITDIFVLPTYYPEGVPRVLLEAGSMGLPLIVANNAGSNEVVKDGHNGFIIPPQNVNRLVEKLNELIIDKDLRKQFGENSRKYICNNYDIKYIVGQYTNLYNRFLSKKSDKYYKTQN